MNERLLQFIWQFQLFQYRNLQTQDGEPLQLVSQGKINTNQGPDFLEAKIKIGETFLIGNVELHIHASDWYRHHHEKDINYGNIILHVVWYNNMNVKDIHDCILPTLELQALVSSILLQQYENLMFTNQTAIRCHLFLPMLDDLTWMSWKERLMAERIDRRNEQHHEILTQNKGDWEDLFWRMLARNFGIKVNADRFEQIAQSISIQIIAKCSNQPIQVEALLLGQAGFLRTDAADEYSRQLKKEYQFLAAKYQLQPIAVQPIFLRMRPHNFPTIRLSQLAGLLLKSRHLFAQIIEISELKQVVQLFQVIAHPYWNNHYKLGELSEGKSAAKHLGMSMIENIMMNTVIPMLYSFGAYKDKEVLKEKALNWLLQLKPEKNKITEEWNAAHIQVSNALDSQSLIELYNNYCTPKKCLECAVGLKILKSF